MSQMHQHRKNACRFDYEFMGKSVEELSSTYGWPVAAIEAEAQINDWVRKIDCTELPETRDIKQFADQLADQTRSRLNVISLFRQIDQQAIITQIENSALDKIAAMMETLNGNDTKSAAAIQSLLASVASIQARNPLDLSQDAKEALGKTGTVIQILNQVN